ncbi:hypothetical protein MVEN_01405700 [Mycena venus]|uniref:Myb/SANT-like domain-containing protein n=1 Tax=Mycena venus TaxID=2733690 RepID=A0A8H6XYE8_9AGAR|nr:hypothetical protein MVEN_01405700 [Mycena venus]
MAPAIENADWLTDPEDKPVLVDFFHSIKSRIGEGGNWDKTALNDAATYMASRGAPKKGGPKTAQSIKSQWGTLKLIAEALMLVKQKQYPGMSGWTYDDTTGFSVTETNRAEWKELVKVHKIFKPFATQGWALYYTMHILPCRAKGLNVFNPGLLPMAGSQPQDSDTQSQNSDSPSALYPAQEFDFSFMGDESQSQPFSDWSQSVYGTQPDDAIASQLALQLLELSAAGTVSLPSSQQSLRPTLTPQSLQPPSTLASRRAPTAAAGAATAAPAQKLKRSSSNNADIPWKRSKTGTAANALHGLVGSVSDIVGVLHGLAPKESSAPSPTKVIAKAQQLAREDADKFVIMEYQQATLSYLFGHDPQAADAFIAEADAQGREILGKILLEKFH